MAAAGAIGLTDAAAAGAPAEEVGFRGLPEAGADDLLRIEAESQAMNDIAQIMQRQNSLKKKHTRKTFAPRMAQFASGDEAPPPDAPPPVIAAINAQTKEQVISMVEEALANGACGVFLVNPNFDYPQLLPIVRSVRAKMPTIFLGVNFTTMNGAEAFPILGRLAREGVKVDAYWADSGCIEHEVQAQPIAEQIKQARANSGWDGLYFGGVAVRNPKGHAKLCQAVPGDKLKEVSATASRFMDVITTSGPEAHVPPDESKLTSMREGCDTTPLCLATTGLTAEDLRGLKGEIDAFILQMDDSQNTPELDVEKLKLLVEGS